MAVESIASLLELSQDDFQCGQCVASPVHMDDEPPVGLAEVNVTESVRDTTPTCRPSLDYTPTQRPQYAESSPSERPATTKGKLCKVSSVPRKPCQRAVHKMELIHTQVEQIQQKLEQMLSNVDKIMRNLTLMSTQLSTLAACQQGVQ